MSKMLAIGSLLAIGAATYYFLLRDRPPRPPRLSWTQWREGEMNHDEKVAWAAQYGLEWVGDYPWWRNTITGEGIPDAIIKGASWPSKAEYAWVMSQVALNWKTMTQASA